MSTRTKLRPPQVEDPTRLHRVKESSDKFYVDPAIIPDGMSYEWKRITYIGKEDRAHQARMTRNHWRAVPSSRHPEIIGDHGDEPIVVDGLMLMERPKYLTDEAQTEAQFNAVRQRDEQIARLNEIQIGKGMEQSRPEVTRNFERVAIPEDGGDEAA